MIRAQVIVRPRASIFDPQGDAVRRAIHHLGLKEVTQVHVGKSIELELDAPNLAAARTQLETICRDLLSNPVIEDYELSFPGAAKATAAKKSPAQPAAKAKLKVKKPVAKKTAKPVKKVTGKKTGKKK